MYQYVKYVAVTYHRDQENRLCPEHRREIPRGSLHTQLQTHQGVQQYTLLENITQTITKSQRYSKIITTQHYKQTETFNSVT